MNPLSCQILYDDGILAIVSRFTSFTKNFAICCYHVTKIFCSRYGCASVFCKKPLLSASSCRRRSFGPSGSEFQYCACPIPLFIAALKLIHEKNSRVRPYELEHLHPQDSPQILLTIRAGQATGFPIRSRCLHFFFIRFLLVHAVGLSVLCYSYSRFLLMRDAM